MKDIAKGLVYAGIFAVPAVVLIISNSLFFPFITGKNFTFRIIVEIIFAAWVILALYEPQYRPKFSWVGASFLGLLVVMFFANLLGEHPATSFWSNFERMDGYVTLAHTFLYMLVVGSVLKSEKVWNRFFNTTIAVAVVAAFYAFAQLGGQIEIRQGGWRLDGTLGNSAYMAVYMLFHVFITLLMFLRTKGNAMRYVYGGLALIFTYLLAQTATRGTILGLVGGSLVMVGYMALFARGYPQVRKFAVGGLLSVVAIIALFITFKESAFIQQKPYLERVASISLNEAKNRFNIWSMAFEGVKERPILGWGQSNYNYVFNKYYKPELHGQEAWFDRVHNIVMDWLIAGGFLGALMYFSVALSALYYLLYRPLFRGDESFSLIERGVLLGLIVGYFIHNFVVFDNIVSYIFYAVILAYIHARVATSFPSLERTVVNPRIVEHVVAPVVALVLAGTVYYVNVPNILAARDIIDAFKAQTPETVLARFETALSRNSFADQEIREQMMQRIQPFFRDPSIPEEFKQKAFKRVEEELLKQLEEKPRDARAHVFIASFYRLTNNTAPAAEQLAIARSLSPRKQLIIYEQGVTEVQRGDYVKAMEFFKEAYDLGPQFSESRTLYAMSAVYNDRTDLVEELLDTPEARRSFALNDLAIQAVYSKKMFPLLIEMFETRVASDPKNAQLRTSLAYVYHASGDTKKAIETLREAIEEITDPAFKTQAETFIDDLENGRVPREQ